MDKKIKGEDIMIFIPDGNDKKSIAYATNHVLTISASVSNDSNKDEGGDWEAGDITTKNWNITTDNIYCGSNYDELFDIMIAGDTVDIVFGHKAENYKSLADGQLDNWTPATGHTDGYLYEGKALISDLTWNAPSGENATLSATFTGVGSLKKKQ